jgi:hypothetical protein
VRFGVDIPPNRNNREPRATDTCVERADGARSTSWACSFGSCHVCVETSKKARSVSETYERPTRPTPPKTHNFVPISDAECPSRGLGSEHGCGAHLACGTVHASAPEERRCKSLNGCKSSAPPKST